MCIGHGHSLDSTNTRFISIAQSGGALKLAPGRGYPRPTHLFTYLRRRRHQFYNPRTINQVPPSCPMSSQGIPLPVDDDEPQPCQSPFDDSDADLIIRSSDGMRFAVHTLLLRKASPVFAGMLTLPRAGADDQTPVVDLCEDSKTVLAMLQLCYPIGGPALDTLGELCALLDVCEKYMLDGPQQNLVRMHLHRFVEQEPLRVYATAVRVKSPPELARLAARRCLHKPLAAILAAALPDEFRHVPAPLYHSLLRYDHACRTAASAVVASYRYTWVPSMRVYCWASCTSTKCKASITAVRDAQGGLVRVKKWFMTFLQALARSLAEQPEPTSRISMPWRVGAPRQLQCEACAKQYLLDLDDFLPKLQEQVERALNAVRGFVISRLVGPC